MLSACFNSGLAEKDNYSVRGAGQIARASNQHVTNVYRMEAVYVFFRADSHNHFIFVDMLWKGQLNKDSVNCRICVQLINQLEKLRFGSCFRKMNAAVFHSDFSKSLLFTSNIAYTGRIFAYQNNCQTGFNSPCL